MFKPFVSDFEKHQAQFEVDVKKNKKKSMEAFVTFLHNMSVVPLSQKPQISAKPTNDSKASAKSDFESPALCSTRVETSYKPDVVVSEVKTMHKFSLNICLIDFICRSKKNLRK